MSTRQSYGWASACLWTFLCVAVIAVSGCATIQGYQRDKAKYDRQDQRNKDLVSQYSEELRELNGRPAAYDKTGADEARLNEENTKLRQRIAEAESALSGQRAAQQTSSNSAFKELGKFITAETYEQVLKELGVYTNLANICNRQLATLSSFQNGSLEYIRAAEIMRAQALLDVISEAVVTVNIPREALREPTVAGDPKFEQALITLADAQDQMLIAVNDFKLQGQGQSNKNYSVAQSSCVKMLAAITAVTASHEDRSPSAKDLIVRLKAMRTVTDVTNKLLTTTNDLMNSSPPLAERLLVAQSLKGYQPIAQQLSCLIPTRSNISAVEVGQPTNSETRVLNRMEWAMTMSTYCQGDAFKPETYLQMRLGEIRPLKAAVSEVVESYKLAHAQPGIAPADGPTTQPAKELILDLGNKVMMKLVQIPAGKFMMGSPKDEKDRFDNEGPQHEVTISKAFYIGAYDVTQEQYERIMGNNPSRFKGAQNPVEQVSWNDAVEFCKKLSQKTGKTVRLPTEAQWEYACRAGSKTRFSYGDDNDYSNLGDYAWYTANSESKTHPVGQKKPNAWGLYDMHGNVWQWCSDWYADSYANAGKTDPSGSASGSGRVLRGGGWYGFPRICRSAFRDWFDPDLRYVTVGFRVVVDSK